MTTYGFNVVPKVNPNSSSQFPAYSYSTAYQYPPYPSAQSYSYPYSSAASTLPSGQPPYTQTPPYPTHPGYQSTQSGYQPPQPSQPVYQPTHPGYQSQHGYQTAQSPPYQAGTTLYSNQMGVPPSVSPNHSPKHNKSGILDKAGMALAGTVAGGGLIGTVLHGKKGLKSHKKAQKKALKYGLPIAGAGLGAYALKKGFHRSSSSSSSSSD